MLRSRSLKGAIASLLLAIPLATPAAGAGTHIPVKPFRSITLRSGGEVLLRHGATQRVTLLEGSMDCVTVTVEGDGELVIESHRSTCRKGHDLTVEVVTPAVEGLMVTDGGRLQSLGSFPSQKELLGTVDDGGLLDVRSIKAEKVLATVRDGGRILARAEKNLLATVSQGGAITYWGEPRVQSSITQGGVVAPGKPGDLDKPLDEVDLAAQPPVPPVPPVPAVPPTPPTRRRSI